jgi:nucleotide-binding universal stress UspA family protein
MALERILTAVGEGGPERSDRLLAHLLDVATGTDATVFLGHVFSDDEFDDVLDRLGYETGASGTDPTGLAERHTRVGDLAERLEAEGVAVEIRGAVGDYGPTIVQMARDIDADLVVVGGRGRSPAQKAVFGSTAQEVLLNAPCPVTYVRE